MASDNACFTRGLSSGGLFGQGIGASQQKWGNLPEAHTDFIFAVLGEELGLVGTLLALALFGAVAFAAIRLAINTADPFVRYVSAGVTAALRDRRGERRSGKKRPGRVSLPGAISAGSARARTGRSGGSARSRRG